MIPDYKEMVVGHYNFIDTDKHGEKSYLMLSDIESFRSFTSKQVRLHNIMVAWRKHG